MFPFGDRLSKCRGGEIAWKRSILDIRVWNFSNEALTLLLEKSRRVAS